MRDTLLTTPEKDLALFKARTTTKRKKKKKKWEISWTCVCQKPQQRNAPKTRNRQHGTKTDEEVVESDSLPLCSIPASPGIAAHLIITRVQPRSERLPRAISIKADICLILTPHFIHSDEN